MVTTDDPQVLSRWLMDNFVPSGKAEIESWKQLVRRTLATSTLPGLVDLVLAGNDEEQYQAVAAAWTLGAQIWAAEDDLAVWTVKLPGKRRARPTHSARCATHTATSA
jgi:hypothetical protein